ncbi:MAG: flagellar basal body-associated FliL family protein [Nitrospirae bacterium]|nr:flagellar basal body-associated FliL family protein [Nitrospirota bacterium]
MAKENEDVKSEDENKKADVAQAKGKGGKPGLIKLVIIAVVALMLMGGGFFGYKVFSKKEHGPEKGELAKEEKEKHEPGQMIALDPFVINLADEDIKYLKITINLEVDSEKVKEEATNRMPQIRDTILMLMTSKTSEDVKDVGGKLKLQDEMVSRINHNLSVGKVKSVYFTEFVMQ